MRGWLSMPPVPRLHTETGNPVNVEAALGAVENEVLKLALEIGLHLQELEPEHLRADGDRVRAAPGGGRLVDKLTRLGGLLSDGMDGVLDDRSRLPVTGSPKPAHPGSAGRPGSATLLYLSLSWSTEMTAPSCAQFVGIWMISNWSSLIESFRSVRAGMSTYGSRSRSSPPRRNGLPWASVHLRSSKFGRAGPPAQQARSHDGQESARPGEPSRA